uniref:Uncharacterized protein n=1 Tax=Kalanchoe fedtschenkoi TaxID=63787 RepID=A0A7N0UQF3_KALFE
MADSSDKLQSKPARLLNRSLAMRSTPAKHDSLPKPYLYQPLDRSNSLRKFYASIEKAPAPLTVNSVPSKVGKLCRLFDSQKISSKLKLSGSARAPNSTRLPGAEDEVVVYFTSLRGVRRMYEDCYAVRMIFRGLRVYVDVRDVSMEQS